MLLLLLFSEVFIYAVLRQHFLVSSKPLYNITVILNITLSIWLWIIYVFYIKYNSFYDSPDHIWLQLSLTGAICAIVIPRLLVISMHYIGRLSARNGHRRIFTNTGLILGGIILITVITGTLHGRFNFKFEEQTIGIRDLHDDLDGFTIVHISDLHLAGFHHHSKELSDVITRINEIKSDIIVNTGDFVTYGWREYGRHDTILAKSKARYGKYAVSGNHDSGNYHPEFTEGDNTNNILNINNLVKSSGYRLLNDEAELINVGKSRILLMGVTTGGRHGHIVYGNLDSADRDLQNVDLQILLTHDPNHWINEIAGKRNNIDITLSGHTHGMQMGIYTSKFRWSPISFYYPNWNGLYSQGNQYQYVNRGLGVLSVPFRIMMPPEITILRLKKI